MKPGESDSDPLPIHRPAGDQHSQSLDKEWDHILAESGFAEQAGLPPSVLATPGDVRHVHDEDIQWWRPGWHDVRAHVGWRWVLLLPSGLLALLGLRYVFYPFSPLWLIETKLLLFTGGVALALAGYVARRAAQARREPFCIFCGYELTGLPDRYRCPECGRPYTWRLIAEYRRDPHWFIERYRELRRLPPADSAFEAGPVRRRRSRDGT